MAGKEKDLQEDSMMGSKSQVANVLCIWSFHILKTFVQAKDKYGVRGQTRFVLFFSSSPRISLELGTSDLSHIAQPLCFT